MGDMLLMPPCFTETTAFRDSSFAVNIALATDDALTEYVIPHASTRYSPDSVVVAFFFVFQLLFLFIFSLPSTTCLAYPSNLILLTSRLEMQSHSFALCKSFPHGPQHIGHGLRSLFCSFMNRALASPDGIVRYSSHTIDRVAFWNSVRRATNRLVRTHDHHHYHDCILESNQLTRENL